MPWSERLTSSTSFRISARTGCLPSSTPRWPVRGCERRTGTNRRPASRMPTPRSQSHRLDWVKAIGPGREERGFAQTRGRGSRAPLSCAAARCRSHGRICVDAGLSSEDAVAAALTHDEADDQSERCARCDEPDPKRRAWALTTTPSPARLQDRHRRTFHRPRLCVNRWQSNSA
jgi:hypothetical protein